MTRKVSAEVNKGGRPRKLQPDAETLAAITDLAGLACTNREAASFLHVGERTFETFLATFPEAREAWDHGHDGAKTSLRRKLFTLADTNAASAIFLAKNLLGMKDGPTVVELDLSSMSDEQVALLAAALDTARRQNPAAPQGASGTGAPKTTH